MVTSNWINLYKRTIDEIEPNLSLLDGILVGLNVNVDAVIFVKPQMILKLIKDLKIAPNDLVKRIAEWKGVIEYPEDFVTALCGCFSQGKASEWIIENKKTYNYLLQNLPIDAELRMGGQAGIMSEVLAQIDIPNIFVHAVSLSKEQRRLFSEKENIKIPILNEQKKIEFKHPRNAKSKSDELYLHIISEFDKGDVLSISKDINWTCPRDNRFIATYDPPNSKLDLIDGFQQGIEILAKRSNGFIISGFHMLELKQIGIDGIQEKIIRILDLLLLAKKANPELVLQLELCSTKNKEILNQLISISKERKIWNSLSCNERELGEILEILGYHKLSKGIKQKNMQEDIIEGCLIISKELSLKRFHLHEFGCYILISEITNTITPDKLTSTLLFSAIITSYRASSGEKIVMSEIRDKLNDLLDNFQITKTFHEIADSLEKNHSINKDEFLTTGTAITNNYQLIAIPTILIDHPRLTVGLGDTISSTALSAELAIRKKSMG